jgi:hypothetical protein
MVITHAATTAITAVIHITEHIITMAGRTTAVIDITGITSVITTTINAVVSVGVNWLAWKQFQASFSRSAKFR